MSLPELRAFLTLTETGHFGRAAERLHISQPALTKQIQRLEARLGGPLLQRSGRTFALSRAGEMLRHQAESLLSQADRTERLVRLALTGHSGLLRIGFGIATLASGLGALLREHRRRYPEVQVSMRDMPTPAQLQALEREDIDVGFVRLPVANPDLYTLPLFQERLVVAYPTDSRPPGERGLAPLANAPFVSIQQNLSQTYHQHMMQTCRAAGFAPRVVQEAGELLTVLHLVGAGLGFSLVPDSARAMQVPHVSFRETEVEECSWRIGLVWHRRERSDPLVDAFVALASSMGHGGNFGDERLEETPQAGGTGSS